MNDIKVIKLDTAYPDFQGKELGELLSSGWRVLEKASDGERYVVYILTNQEL